MRLRSSIRCLQRSGQIRSAGSVGLSPAASPYESRRRSCGRPAGSFARILPTSRRGPGKKNPMRPPTWRSESTLSMPMLVTEHVDGIVHVGLGVDGKPPRNMAPSLGAVLMGRIKRVGLQGANPDGIEALVKYSEGREEPARGDGDVRTGNVVDLSVVDVLIDWSAVGSATRRTLKLAFKFRSRLDQPAVSQGHKQNWIDLGIDQILPTSDEAERADTAAQDRDWLFSVCSLGANASRTSAIEAKRDDRHGQYQPPRARSFCYVSCDNRKPQSSSSRDCLSAGY